MPKTDTSHDITVTTATRSADDVRASLGVSTPEPPADDKAAQEKTDADATAAAEKTASEEAESAKPDADVSEAARTLRKNRADARKAAIQGEINALTKRRGDTQREIDGLEARKKALRDELDAATRRPATLATPAATVTPGSEPPTFAFPTWEQYQAKHPDADYTQYVDERTDARHQWNTDVAKHTQRLADERAAAEKRQADDAAAKTATERAETDALAKYSEAATTFATDRPDFAEVTGQVNFGQLGWSDGRVAHLRSLILREAANGPALLYHLATHPDDLARLGPQAIQDPEGFVSVFGEIRYAAKAASTPAAHAAPAAPVPGASTPPREPAKPKSAAPAPLTALPGTASATRTAAQIAEDDEDADEYIQKRQKELRAQRGG